MGMYVVRAGRATYLKAGRFDNRMKWHEISWGNLDEALMFESQEALDKWLDTSTNCCSRSFWNRHIMGRKCALVLYTDEAVALINRLVERMS